MILFASKAMIPELNNIDEEDYWVSRQSIQVRDDEWTIVLNVKSDVEEIDSIYELKAIGVKAYSISSAQDGDLFLLDESHPVMIQHCDATSELYCQVSESNRFSILHHVLAAHQQIVADWFDPFEFINKAVCRGWTFGQLAKGPTKIIAAYLDAVQPHAIKANTLDNGPQKDWDGSAFNVRDTDVIGICFGSSYIICKQYELANKALVGTPLRGAPQL